LETEEHSPIEGYEAMAPTDSTSKNEQFVFDSINSMYVRVSEPPHCPVHKKSKDVSLRDQYYEPLVYKDWLNVGRIENNRHHMKEEKNADRRPKKFPPPPIPHGGNTNYEKESSEVKALTKPAVSAPSGTDPRKPNLHGYDPSANQKTDQNSCQHWIGSDPHFHWG
jgi:hypothetical protein